MSSGLCEVAEKVKLNQKNDSKEKRKLKMSPVGLSRTWAFLISCFVLQRLRKTTTLLQNNE